MMSLLCELKAVCGSDDSMELYLPTLSDLPAPFTPALELEFDVFDFGQRALNVLERMYPEHENLRDKKLNVSNSSSSK